MKKLILLFVLFIPLNVTAEKVTLKVDGMSCSSCAQALNRAFSRKVQLKGFASDVPNREIVLETEKENEISDDEIKEVVKKTGYELLEIHREK